MTQRIAQVQELKVDLELSLTRAAETLEDCDTSLFTEEGRDRVAHMASRIREDLSTLRQSSATASRILEALQTRNLAEIGVLKDAEVVLSDCIIALRRAQYLEADITGLALEIAKLKSEP